MADILDALAADQLYQFDYTAPLHAEFGGDAWPVSWLCAENGPIVMPRSSTAEQVLSVLPELSMTGARTAIWLSP